ncbi:MAG: hypothetical protein AAFX99_31585, partial [Myxococcota bacterium]
SPSDRCLQVCESIARCPELNAQCDAHAVEQLLAVCAYDFCEDPPMREVMHGLEDFPCSDVVPLMLGLVPEEIADVCFGLAEPTEGVLGSRITRLHVVADSDQGFDWDGDGSPDNALGQLWTQLEAMWAGNSDALNGWLECGQLGLGLDWAGLEGLPLDAIDDGGPLNGYRLDGVDPEGRYVPSHDSFIRDVPRYAVPNVQVHSNMVEASGGSMPIYFGFGEGIVLPVRLLDVKLEALLERDRYGMSVREGRLGGHVPLADVIAGLNAFARSEPCACLGLTEDLIVATEPFGYMCQNPPGSTCRGEAEQCTLLAGGCSLAVAMLEGQTDPISPDGIPALSTLIEFTAEGALLALP